MTTIRRILICAGAGTILSCCATSLDKSHADRFMRFEGSYTCESFSKEPASHRETLAEKDASRVRCARDSWSIQGNKIYFTRSLYQSKDCTVPLGKIQFQSVPEKISNGFALQKAACEIVRSNVGWVGERSGRCLLKDLNVNKAYPLRDKNCSAYVPEVCKDPQFRMELIAPAGELNDDHRGPVSQVIVTRDHTGEKGVCERYAKD